MKMFLTLALVAVAAVASAQEPVDYSTAYHRSAEDNRPLLVLVTAEWCPPCQIMKATTLPELEAINAFAGVNLAAVDYDKQPELASQLIGDRGLPQILLFKKVDDRWERRFLTGIQTVASVETFMENAGIVVRVADATAVPAVEQTGEATINKK